MNRPEEALAVACGDLIAYTSPRCIALHVPNQRGTRKRWEAALLKAMGVRAGAADWIVLLPGPPFRACIELKAEAKGRLSPAQESFRGDCEEYAIPYVVCRSLEDFVGTLRSWGVLFRHPPTM